MGNRDYAAVRQSEAKFPSIGTRARILRVRSREGKRLKRLSDLVELEECFFVFSQLGSKLVRRAP
jgi:hypothetical protein